MASKDKTESKGLAVIPAGLDPEVQALLEDMARNFGNPDEKKKTEKTYKNVKIERVDNGTITLPAGMSFQQARDWLTRMEKDENQTVQIYFDFEAFALDGALAFWRTLREIYGFIDTDPPGGNPWAKTTMVSVEVAPGQFEQVPWGEMVPPGIDGVLQTDADFNGEVPKFIIRGEVRKKHQKAMDYIAARTRDRLRSESIYRGHATRVNLAFMMGTERFNMDRHAPKFIDLSGRSEDELILADETMLALNTEIWSRIEHTQMLRDHGVRIKHGVILAGPFGTGKTLTSEVTALKSTRCGWTYIYLDNANQLPWGVKFARLFGPTVLFAEDVDGAIQGQERTDFINKILNSIDGVDNKNQDVIVVLTTNNLEDVNQGFLRAGRTDGIIFFTPPDAPTSQKFIARELGTALASDVNLEDLGDDWAGVIPAFISEACNKMRTHALHSFGSIEGKVDLTIMKAVRKLMEPHIAMVTGKRPERTMSAWDLLQEARITVRE